MSAPLASDRVLARLSQLHPKRIDLSLGRIERLLATLGNPQEKLPPVVHVAGTKGKGSTVATMRACLEAAGYRVHAYTSPHLIRFHERIRLAGELIDEEVLLAILEECERANRGEPITFFEITTVAAFLAFSRTPAGIVLLEVGMGGRLDTTNVIRHPAVTAITPVSLDHQAFLGDTIAAIAGEKAGILKPGVPAVIGPQPGEAETVIEARAAAIGAPLYCSGREWNCFGIGQSDPALTRLQAAPSGTLSRAAGEGGTHRTSDGGVRASEMRYEGPRWRLDLPLPSLVGPHQILNAGVALACLEQLRDFTLPPSAIAEGLRHIDWPARLQRLAHGPLVDMLLPAWELWLDGAHNALAAEAVAEVLKGWRDRPLDLIVGMLNTKDAGAFFVPLAPYTRSVQAVTIPGEENPHPAAQIAAAARAAGLEAHEAASVDAALGAIIERPGPARVLICGSLHLAGVVLAENG